MAGMGRGLLVGAALGMVALTSASAEPIPLPTPAPLPKEGASSSTRTGTAAQAAGSALKSLFHLDREPEAAATPSSTTTAFNSAQRAQVDKVSAYLSTRARGRRNTVVDHHRFQLRPARAGRQGQRLSFEHPAIGRRFCPDRSRRQPRQGRVLHPEARQGPLRL